jgi:phosphate transport system permease protein
MFIKGVPPIFKIGFGNFFTGLKWKPTDIPALYGILPMIAGSLCVTLGAVVFGVPAGLLTAVFLSSYCPKPLLKLMRPAVNLLAGIPSVVYGFFGLKLLVPFVRNTFGGDGNSILTASILLGVMILPTIIKMSEEAVIAVPGAYYEGALSLGATKEQSLFKVVVPAAKSGIFAGIVLGIGRAFGETMAVIWVAGNQAVLPKGILSGVRTLTSNIVLEMGYAADLHLDALFGTAVALFIFILILNIVFSRINKGSG